MIVQDLPIQFKHIINRLRIQ